jgi:hypothetical protein
LLAVTASNPLRRTPAIVIWMLAVSLAACSGAARRPADSDRALVLDGNGWVDFGDPGDRFDLVPGGQRTFALWLRYTRPQYHAKILDKMQG